MKCVSHALLIFVVLLLCTKIASQTQGAPAADEINEDNEAILRLNARQTKAQTRKREIDALLANARRENDVLAKARSQMRRSLQMVNEVAGRCSVCVRVSH